MGAGGGGGGGGGGHGGCQSRIEVIVNMQKALKVWGRGLGWLDVSPELKVL